MHRARSLTVLTPYDRLTTLCLTLITPSPPYASSSTSRLLSLLCLSQTRNSTTSPLLSPNVVVVTFHSLYEHFLFRPYPSTTPVCWPDGEAQIDSQPHPPAQVYLLRSPSPSDVTSPITPRHPTRHTRTSRTHLHTVTYTRTPVLISPHHPASPPAASAGHCLTATQLARLRRFLCCSVYLPSPTSLHSLSRLAPSLSLPPV